MARFWRLVIAVLFCEAAGGMGAVFTTANIPTWYAALNKPGFTPPNWIFAPVWTVLYALMGVSLFLIWDVRRSRGKSAGISFFFAQLAANIIWSAVFFGAHDPGGGLVTIIILWFLILGTILNFRKVRREAAFLLYPYLAWVFFAGLLNLAVMLLNP